MTWVQQNLQQQQQQERQRQSREKRQHRNQRRQQHISQRQQGRYQPKQQEEEHIPYYLRRSASLDELMHQYNWGCINPEDTDEIWEQEHSHNLEQYAQFIQNELLLDEQDQLLRINDMENIQHDEEHTKNEELLLQKEEWEDISFRIQQMR